MIVHLDWECSDIRGFMSSICIKDYGGTFPCSSLIIRNRPPRVPLASTHTRRREFTKLIRGLVEVVATTTHPSTNGKQSKGADELNKLKQVTNARTCASSCKDHAADTKLEATFFRSLSALRSIRLLVT
jgi:hypothetical protein